MIVEFDKSFLKSLSKVKDSRELYKVKSQILQLEKAKGLNNIKSLKKLIGFKNYYRIRVGNYRIGFETINKKPFV